MKFNFQGVYGLPKCLGENHKLCDYVRRCFSKKVSSNRHELDNIQSEQIQNNDSHVSRLLNYGAYVGWIQRLLVQVLPRNQPSINLGCSYQLDKTRF